MAQDDIQGQVVDAQGNPVSGAIVELTKSYQSSPLDEQVVRRTTTDANGNYIFEFHPDGDGTTQEWHVSCYNHDGTAYVNSFNNPGVTADLSAIPDSGNYQWYVDEGSGGTLNPEVGDVTQTIEGATWQSLSSATGGFYLDLDGTDDRLRTDETIQLTDPFTVFGWIRPRNIAFTTFSATFWSNEDFGTDIIGHGISDGGSDATISTAAGDGSPSSVVSEAAFVGNGSWGFFALIRSGNEHRLITFDNTQELDDQSATDAVASTTPTDTLFWGDGRYGNAEMDVDFHGFANSALTKTEIMDLWEATNDR